MNDRTEALVIISGEPVPSSRSWMKEIKIDSKSISDFPICIELDHPDIPEDATKSERREILSRSVGDVSFVTHALVLGNSDIDRDIVRILQSRSVKCFVTKKTPDGELKVVRV